MKIIPNAGTCDAAHISGSDHDFAPLITPPPSPPSDSPVTVPIRRNSIKIEPVSRKSRTKFQYQLMAVTFFSFLLVKLLQRTNTKPIPVPWQGSNNKDSNNNVNNLLDPLGRHDPICRSLYASRGSSRSSPLIFQRDNVMVCQTPKIGTRGLRCIHEAYDAQRNFSYYADEAEGVDGARHCNPKYVRKNGRLAQLNDLKDRTEFANWLYSDDHHRIMFVRHPIRRILSGFLQGTLAFPYFWDHFGYKGEQLGSGPEAFQTWILNSTFGFQYDGKCSRSSTYFEHERLYQHFAPPQHCRCGIWDCGAQWEFFKIEDYNMVEVMRKYIPGQWLPPSEDNGTKIHSKTYDEREYLTPTILQSLNYLTREEQDFFGYQPLTLNDLTAN